MTSASLGATPAPAELAALTTLTFERLEAEAILEYSGAAVARLGPCRTVATYRLAVTGWEQSPHGQLERPDVDHLVAGCGGTGPVEIPGLGWGWAFPLRHRDKVEGSLVVSADT